MKSLIAAALLAISIVSAEENPQAADWIGKTVIIKTSKQGSACFRVEKSVPKIGTFNKTAADTCSFKIREGAAPDTIAFESVSNPELFLTHSAGRIVLMKGVDPSGTFRIVAPLRGNQGMSFQSFNLADHHVALVDRENLGIVKDVREPRKTVFYLEELPK
jgi:hypothetical protein